MAETIRRRLTRPDEMLDDRLEPADTCALRARCRSIARRAYKRPGIESATLATLLDLPILVVEGAMQSQYFGRAWRMLEDASPRLCRIRVPVADLPEQMMVAENILRVLGTVSIASHNPTETTIS